MDKQQFIEMALNDLYSGTKTPPQPREYAAEFAEYRTNYYLDGSYAIQWDCFKGIWGHFSHSWNPETGWEVTDGRGVSGRGQTLPEAHTAEKAAYDAACNARDL